MSIPGEDLHGEIVNPVVTELPAPVSETHETIEKEKEEKEATTQAPCNEITPVSSEAINWLNHFDLPEGEVSPVALKGELITSMEQMSVSSSYGTVFKRLISAKLDSGATVWFGFFGNLNDEEDRVHVSYDLSGEQPLFGATVETHDHFAWGQPEGALMVESQKIVEKYEHCFE